ncbi:nucleotide-binding alpha-beta plait domain-containing protein [Tanacetum coccineum]
MGSKRTKEDDVLKISPSVFVTNFPEQVSAKDLWNACKQYRHVVDAFIPNKRSKAGKRFRFVCFIKVFDMERLVGNLCTVWIGRHRIHANAARFHRPKGSTSSHQPAMKGKIKDSSIGNTKDNGHRDDVKKVGVLENLKVALGNEGFTDIDLRYMGGLWVMIAFDSVEAKEKFLLSTGVCSWFSQLIQASSEFIIDKRVTIVEIEGIPLKVWNENTFIRIASKWETLLNVENLEKENYHCKRLCVLTKSDGDVQGENDVSRVSDTEVEEENPKSKDGSLKVLEKGGSIINVDGYLVKELADLEMIIDKGDASFDTLHKRAKVVKSIQEVDKLWAMEASQKAKIKWAIEGDENSKIFTMVLLKRNETTFYTRGYGGRKIGWKNLIWLIMSPYHFRIVLTRTKYVRPMLKYGVSSSSISMHNWDLEGRSVKRLKRRFGIVVFINLRVPDGFTFGFYKRFWSLIAKRCIGGQVRKLGEICIDKILGYEIVDEMVARLSKWKMKTLSIGKKLGNVADYLFWGGGFVGMGEMENLTWSFRRAPKSGVEHEQIEDLMDLSGRCCLVSRLIGVIGDDGSGEFSVASARKVFDDNRFPEVSTQTRWIKSVPIKVNIHAWKVRMDCLPTRLNISRRDNFRKIFALVGKSDFMEVSIRSMNGFLGS